MTYNVSSGTLNPTIPYYTILVSVWWCVLVHTACSLLSVVPVAPTNWKKGRILGIGGFGQVFLCYDVETGRELAVKQVHIFNTSEHISKVLCSSHCTLSKVK